VLNQKLRQQSVVLGTMKTTSGDEGERSRPGALDGGGRETTKEKEG
jgi:hypothetical protein